MTKLLKTDFAPAERADAASVAGDVEKFVSAGLVDHVTHILPCVVMILNKQRQVVYRNQRLLDLLNVSSDEEIFGKRPGELLDCIHANETKGGCGTTLFCKECGAVHAIWDSQVKGVATESECRITTRKGEAFEFRVWALPYELDGSNYTVFALVDIRDEKRRHALERTFFHDVNNTLNALSGYTNLIKAKSKVSSEYVDAIQMATWRLVDEIASHRKMVEAENGELALNLTYLSSRELLEDVIKLVDPDHGRMNNDIGIKAGAGDFSVFTDQALLSRVIGNMVKNAFEATTEGETITLNCSKKEDTVVFSVHNPGQMPPKAQVQIFVRSFSTKGKGRGLGTYSMKLFGEKYLKGKVWFHSSEEEGTTFYISIPISHPDS